MQSVLCLNYEQWRVEDITLMALECRGSGTRYNTHMLYTRKADIVMAFAYRHMQSSKLRANSASEIEAFRILGAK